MTMSSQVLPQIHPFLLNNLKQPQRGSSQPLMLFLLPSRKEAWQERVPNYAIQPIMDEMISVFKVPEDIETPDRKTDPTKNWDQEAFINVICLYTKWKPKSKRSKGSVGLDSGLNKSCVCPVWLYVLCLCDPWMLRISWSDCLIDGVRAWQLWHHGSDTLTPQFWHFDTRVLTLWHQSSDTLKPAPWHHLTPWSGFGRSDLGN